MTTRERRYVKRKKVKLFVFKNGRLKLPINSYRAIAFMESLCGVNDINDRVFSSSVKGEQNRKTVEEIFKIK